MESVKQKMDMYLNDETKDVTFTSDEIVAAKNQEYILYIATESDADIYHSAQGKKKAGLPLTPAETEALKKKEPSDTPKVMDAIRFEEEGDLWIVRKSTSSCAREEEMHMSEADWCKNQTPDKDATDGAERFPYETLIDMKGSYPGTCTRKEFDFDKGICRLSADGQFMLFGYNNQIPTPLQSCFVERKAGESDGDFVQRQRSTMLAESHLRCMDSIPSFDTRADAIRACEQQGCTMIVHDKSKKLLSKPWGALMGSTTQLIENTNTDTSFIQSIDRTRLEMPPRSNAFCRHEVP